MRKADKNEDNKMTLKELKHFLRQINVEVDDMYAEDLFKVKTHRWVNTHTRSIKTIPYSLTCLWLIRLPVAQKCDKSNSGSLEGPEIKHFYELLTNREEIDVIYGQYAETEGQMSSRDLLNFLMNEQREMVPIEYADKLIEKYEVDAAGKQNHSSSWVGSHNALCFLFIGLIMK